MTVIHDAVMDRSFASMLITQYSPREIHIVDLRTLPNKVLMEGGSRISISHLASLLPSRVYRSCHPLSPWALRVRLGFHI